MPSAPHVFRRGATFWWRRKIPRNLIQTFGRHAVAISLRTHIRSEALVRAARLRAATDALFDGVRQTMALGLTLSTAQMNAIILDLIRHEIETAELARALAPERSPEAADAAAARARALRADLQTALRVNRLDGVRGPLDAALDRLQLSLPTDGPEYRLLLRQAAWGMTTVATVNEQREQGLYAEDAFFTIPPTPAAGPMAAASTVPPRAAGDGPSPLISPPGSSAASQPPPIARTDIPGGASITVRQAFDAIIGEKSKSASWVKNMGRKVEATKRLVIEALGDLPLDQIQAEHVVEFRSLLEQLPAGHGKSARDTRSIREIVDDTNRDEQDRLDDLEERFQLGGMSRADYVEAREKMRIPRLTSTTINLHIDRLSSAFAWAIEHDKLSGRNVADGKRLDAYEREARDREVPRADRQPWGREGLHALFSSPAFQGEGLRSDALFWAPLISAHAGLRSEEALQLLAGDIQRKDGVWCFCVSSGAGKTVKNKSSHRDVPIHPTLIDAGLLELLDVRRKQGCTRLFPDLERGAASESFTEIFSKRFGRYTREHGLWRPEHDFHSLRKDFNVRLREAQVPLGARKRLMGHVIRDLTDGTYDPAGAADQAETP